MRRILKLQNCERVRRVGSGVGNKIFDSMQITASSEVQKLGVSFLI